MVFIKKTFKQQTVPKGYGNKEGNVQLGSKKRAFQYEYVWECVTELRREKERKCVCVYPRGLHNKHCHCEVLCDVFLTLLSNTRMHTYTHTETIRRFFCSNSLVSLQFCTAAECQIVFSSQRKAMDLVSGIWLVCVDV